MTGPDRRDETRAALRSQVASAARIIAPAWPLGTFVAVNPLGGLVDRPFEDALGIARPTLGINGVPTTDDLRRALAAGRVTRADIRAAVARRRPDASSEDLDAAVDGLLEADAAVPPRVPRTAAERVDAALGSSLAATVSEETAKWCAAYADADGARWPMPGRERGFYPAWRAVAGRGPTLRRLARHGVRARLAALPGNPEDAVLEALQRLHVTSSERVGALRGHLAAQPGWTAYARWLSEEEGGPGFDPMHLLAVRLTYECELLGAAARAELGESASIADLLEWVAERPPATAQDDRGLEDGAIVIEALEDAYADRLLSALDRTAPASRRERPAAQAVFCIDARSEGLRRHLEGSGPYETLGFAGFFAVAMRFRALASERADSQAPVLIDPRHEVGEVAAPAAGRRHREGKAAAAAAEHGFHAAKDGSASPFALAEVGGWAAAPVAATKTFAARLHARVRGRVGHAIARPPASQLDVDAALTPAEQVLVAETALTMMGLVDAFARLVMLCGHGSTTENNPYAAALNCGACGGHEGGPNARAAATILNKPGVRAVLAERGIAIPEDTWFVAARHDTTTDQVDLLDPHLVPASHVPDVERLAAALAAAGNAQATERLALLPGGAGGDGRDAATRSADWAQVRPEWGLARNAAFVIGPRSMTEGLDLECRTFLHSYDAAVDEDGTALETILTAPLVVAQWINSQYLFSTTDPDVLGAGDKVVHNVVAGVGVLQGAGGDLRLGLPRQACFGPGGEPFHEPLRLLAVAQAPIEIIDAIVARNPILQHFFDGGWVGLAAREAPEDGWLRRGRDGVWRAWEPVAREVAA